MITNHQRRNKTSCPKIQCVEKKRLNLLQSPLMVFKTSIIHFPPLTPQNAQRLHLPQRSTSSVANSPPTSIQTQDNPNRLKNTFQIAQATSQLSRRRSTNSTSLLHKQHQSITMTCRSQKLFMVTIFPKAAGQPKNVTLNGTLVR